MTQDDPQWRLATDDEIPNRFGATCNDFRIRCSNGFIGPLAIGVVFLHRPRWWPQCFHNSEDSDATCSTIIERRVAT